MNGSAVTSECSAQATQAWPCAASRKAPGPPNRPMPWDPWPCLEKSPDSGAPKYSNRQRSRAALKFVTASTSCYAATCCHASKLPSSVIHLLNVGTSPCRLRHGSDKNLQTFTIILVSPSAPTLHYNSSMSDPAFLQNHLRLPGIWRKHSVAHEAIAVAYHDGFLADQFAHGLAIRYQAHRHTRSH